MGNVNRGKQFEDQVRIGFERVPDTSVDRLIDPQNGYAGVRNICDFIVYHYPHEYYIECKSCYGNTLPFSNITTNQWQGLLEKSKYAGVVAGVVVWFIDHDITMFIPIKTLERMRQEGAKSVNVKHQENLNYEHYIVPGNKKRVLFDYDFTRFLGE